MYKNYYFHFNNLYIIRNTVVDINTPAYKRIKAEFGKCIFLVILIETFLRLIFLKIQYR